VTIIDADNYSVPVTADYAPDVVLLHPSSADHEEYLKAVRESIGEAESNLQTYQERLTEAQQKVEMGARPPGFEKRWQKAVQDLILGIQKLQNDLRAAGEFHSQFAEIGRLFAASGLGRRSAQNHRLDWALIRLTESTALGTTDVSCFTIIIILGGLLIKIACNRLLLKIRGT
jgi:hypothetical protein